MKKIPLLIAVSLLSINIAGAATLATNADSYIWQANSTTNYGTANSILTFDGDGTLADVQKGYLQFDASSLPLFTDVDSLTMRYELTVNRTGNFYLLDGTGADSWTETGINWDNAPLNNTGGVDFIAGAGQTVTSLGSIAGNGQFNNITLNFGASEEAALLNALNTGNRIATIGILHSGSVGFQVSSRDVSSGTLAPTLNYTPVPEPNTAFLLLGVAACSLIARRRR